jgi:hypothetical protein
MLFLFLTALLGPVGGRMIGRSLRRKFLYFVPFSLAIVAYVI